MLPDLSSRLKDYVEAFNRTDEECCVQAIDNAHACEFLSSQIPLVDLPDPVLEQTYYFRWWTLRKHWKETPAGHILSEFLPPVPWAGPYNSINCAAGHHFREGRWLCDADGWLREYLLFWLDGHGNAQRYSMWLISAAADYFTLHPDRAFEASVLDRLVDLYERTEREHLHPCGLYWSNDNLDGMEYSISGPGIRPTLNSYLYGDAKAIARLAKECGREALSARFAEKACALKEKIDRLLWDGDFYRTIPCRQDEAFSGERRPPVEAAHAVREEVGFIPWYFGLPDEEKDGAFRCLLDARCFASPYGLTTADQSHPRYLFAHEHECLWNGYVWPFATSQTLTALANLLHTRKQPPVSRADYYRLLRQYAQSHRLVREDGQIVPWIDEVMHPADGTWSARELLKEDGWRPERGGYERGKDYNHSTFCDLILSGLLGIEVKDGRLTADPIIPEDWSWFCVTGLPPHGETVLFDRDGTHYGLGKGLQILQ